MKISPSALKAYLSCNRRYFLESVVRAPRDVPSYVTGGLALDQAVNDYLYVPPPGGNGGNGEQLSLPFPVDPEFAVVKPLLPEPGTVLSQPELRTPVPPSWGLGEDTHEVYGKLDALTPPSFDKMIIIDMKRIYTRSACLTETTLLDDVQAQLYAWLVWRTYLPARVFGRWIYYVRDTKRAHAVDVEFDKGRVDEWVERVVAPAARGMLELWQAPEAGVIEHDPSSCNDGRRCFVARSCPLFSGPIKGEQIVELRTRKKKVDVNPPAVEETIEAVVAAAGEAAVATLHAMARAEEAAPVPTALTPELAEQLVAKAVEPVALYLESVRVHLAAVYGYKNVKITVEL